MPRANFTLKKPPAYGVPASIKNIYTFNSNICRQNFMEFNETNIIHRYKFVKQVMLEIFNDNGLYVNKYECQ